MRREKREIALKITTYASSVYTVILAAICEHKAVNILVV